MCNVEEINVFMAFYGTTYWPKYIIMIIFND